jgi:hypothetical protein
MSSTEFTEVCPKCGGHYIDLCKHCAQEEKPQPEKNYPRKKEHLTFESIFHTIILVSFLPGTFFICWFGVNYPKISFWSMVLILLLGIWVLHKLDKSIKKYEKEKAEKYRQK